MMEEVQLKAKSEDVAYTNPTTLQTETNTTRSKQEVALLYKYVQKERELQYGIIAV